MRRPAAEKPHRTATRRLPSDAVPLSPLSAPMRACLFLAALVLLAGCASTAQSVRTEYAEASNKTTYETKRMELYVRRSSTGINLGPSYHLAARGQCTGASCSPSTYELLFTVDSDNPITMTAEDVRMTYDGSTKTWEIPFQIKRGERFRVLDHIITLEITADRLSAIAQADEVEGSLGSIQFQLSHDARSPLRQLLQTAGG